MEKDASVPRRVPVSVATRRRFIALLRLLPSIPPGALAQSTVNFGYSLLDRRAVVASASVGIRLRGLGRDDQREPGGWARGCPVLQWHPLSCVLPALVVVVVVSL